MAPAHVLFVCTANQCRSPMAEALLRHHLDDRGIDDVSVSSAGEYESGHPATEASVATMAARGLDLAAHRSCTLTPDLVAGADLVLGLARRHVRHAVAMAPEALPRTFTLKELVRRGEAAGPRSPGQPLADWLAVVGAGRKPADLLGDNPDDDVADPIGRPMRAYAATARQLDDLIGRLVAVAFPA